MKRILVANDLTDRSANALGRAIRLAANSGAAVTVLHAADGSADPQDNTSVHRRLDTEARLLAEELTRVPLDISVCISDEAPEAAIVNQAERLDADLIVLGGHGAPRFRDAIFGTTGTHVVRHTDRPILVAQNDDASPYETALVAMDDVATSRLVEAARAIAPACELHAVHAHSPSLSEAFSPSAEIDRHELREERQLEQVITGVRPKRGSNPHAVVRTGDPLGVIMKETERLKPDLLVVGTRQRATFLGSNAVDTLFWCPHDILIVPDPAGAEA